MSPPRKSVWRIQKTKKTFFGTPKSFFGIQPNLSPKQQHQHQKQQQKQHKQQIRSRINTCTKAATKSVHTNSNNTSRKNNYNSKRNNKSSSKQQTPNTTQTIANHKIGTQTGSKPTTKRVATAATKQTSKTTTKNQKRQKQEGGERLGKPNTNQGPPLVGWRPKLRKMGGKKSGRGPEKRPLRWHPGLLPPEVSLHVSPDRAGRPQHFKHHRNSTRRRQEKAQRLKCWREEGKKKRTVP